MTDATPRTLSFSEQAWNVIDAATRDQDPETVRLPDALADLLRAVNELYANAPAHGDGNGTVTVVGYAAYYTVTGDDVLISRIEEITT